LASSPEFADRAACFGPEDFKITGSERAKRLNENDMWLAASDLAWHRPLIVTIREIGTVNKRKRTAAKEKQRYEKWQQKIAKAQAKKKEHEWQGWTDHSKQGWNDQKDNWKDNTNSSWKSSSSSSWTWKEHNRWL
jgi:transketolase